MNEKIYTFPNIEPQKPMTEEEFDKWAEKVTERQNAIADAIEAKDFDRLQAEMGGWNDHIAPLLLVMGLFGTPAQFRKTTKEEVMKRYAYKVNPELFEECKAKFLKESHESLGIEEVENDAVKRWIKVVFSSKKSNSKSVHTPPKFNADKRKTIAKRRKKNRNKKTHR